MRLAPPHEATKHGPAFRNRMQSRLQPTAEFKELILGRLRESISQGDCRTDALRRQETPGYDHNWLRLLRRDIRPSGSMSGAWKRKHGGASNAPTNERPATDGPACGGERVKDCRVPPLLAIEVLVRPFSTRAFWPPLDYSPPASMRCGHHACRLGFSREFEIRGGRPKSLPLPATRFQQIPGPAALAHLCDRYSCAGDDPAAVS
jgi:hypothetical protein